MYVTGKSRDTRVPIGGVIELVYVGVSGDALGLTIKLVMVSNTSGVGEFVRGVLQLNSVTIAKAVININSQETNFLAMINSLKERRRKIQSR